jgi:hypothetical protein
MKRIIAGAVLAAAAAVGLAGLAHADGSTDEAVHCGRPPESSHVRDPRGQVRH